jgi:hypothetical protein
LYTSEPCLPLPQLPDRVPPSAKNRSFEEHSREEVIDLEDATTLLLDDSEEAALGPETTRRLIEELVSRCHTSNRFVRVLAQRMHMLQCVHLAWLRSHQYQHARLRAGSASRSGPKAGRNDLGDARVPPRRAGAKSAMVPGAKTYDVHLGIELFLSLIDFVHDPECDASQRREIVNQIVPALRELAPLSLAQDGG